MQPAVTDSASPSSPASTPLDLRRRRGARGPAGASAAQADRRGRAVHGRAAGRARPRTRRPTRTARTPPCACSAPTCRWPPRCRRCDLIHSHTWYAMLGGMLGAMLQDIPHVVTAHSLEPHRPWKAEQLGGGYRLSSWAERTAFEAADAVIAVSAGMRTDTLDSYRDLDPDKVHVVRNGIDTDEFSPDPGTDVVTGLGIDLDKPDRRLRRPHHPAEGPDPPGAGGRAPGSRHPAGAAGRRPGHPRDRPADRRRVRGRARRAGAT